MNKFLQNKKGFTLIEMLTSVGIIVMVTAIFLANYKTSNRRTDLVMTAQKVVADIHAAQNNALGLVNYGDSFPSGGWGVNFDISTSAGREQYTLFADLNSPAYLETGQESSADWGYMRYDDGEGSPALGARVVTLPKGIVIDSLTTDIGATSLANVTFLPPDPQTNVFDGINKVKYLSIVLRDTGTQETRTVRVNFLGLAEVLD